MRFEIMTVALIAVTVLVSMQAFRDRNLFAKLILWPARMKQPSEYYRFLSSGFIHADNQHLIFNMISLFFMGYGVATYYEYFVGKPMYLLLYLSGIIVSSIPSYLKNRNNMYYSSLGASGGVSAVTTAYVYFAPWSKIIIFVIPMPAILYAVLFIAGSAYMSRQNRDNINHDAHLWGAVYGFLFTWAVDPSHGTWFIENMKHVPAFSEFFSR